MRKPLRGTLHSYTAGLIAAVALCCGGFQLVRAVVLLVDGRTVRAEVVDARYFTKSESVRVHLPAPVDRDADLLAWDGRPAIGDTIAVRFAPAWPGAAIDDRVTAPWLKIGLAFGAAALLALGAWWEAATAAPPPRPAPDGAVPALSGAAPSAAERAARLGVLVRQHQRGELTDAEFAAARDARGGPSPLA